MISVITPVLNGERFIEKNILSIQSLTVPFEHIIVDGGSTDKTLQIISKFPHVKVIHQTKKNGLYGAIHLGYENAKFDYLAWVNCDDIIYSQNYEFALKKAISEKIHFVYGNSEFNWTKEN